MITLAVPVVFICIFAGMWLLMTTAFGAMSGWYELAKRYPDRRLETPLIKLGFQSGRMGNVLGGVSFGGCLTLAGCPSGLRLSVWRIFGPFSRPIFVPWEDIRTEKSTFVGFMMTRLRFGQSEGGSLSVLGNTWDVMKLAVKAHRGQDVTTAMRRALLTMLLIQGGIPTIFAGLLFSVVSRIGPKGPPGLPIVVCFLFPAVVFGAAPLIRYLILRAKFA